jgi:cytochrome c-type biogenesis protein CcmH
VSGAFAVPLAAAALALATLALAALGMRGSRAGLAAVGATLGLGLAGYAMQASPETPGAPAKPADRSSEIGFSVVEARGKMIADSARSRSQMLPRADTFAREGRYADAAAMLDDALADNPEDVEAWLALGNTLVEHAVGALTPPAILAYRRAAAIDPGSVAAGYFLGRALLRQGQLNEGLEVWQATLEASAPGAPGREILEQRIDQLNALLDPYASQRVR